MATNPNPKDQEYSYASSGPKKVDIRPMLTDLGAGVIKGNTADILGLPVDVLDLGLQAISKNSTREEPTTGSSQWFRSLLGMNPEDSSLSETAGTMVSVPGLEKAMIVPFMKLSKKMNRTEGQQKAAEATVKKLTRDDINPETIYNLVQGYADKNVKTGELNIKALISDINATVNKDVLESLSDQYFRRFKEAYAAGDPKAFKHLEDEILDPKSGEQKSTTLGQLLDHPELYELYPELKDIKVVGLSPYATNKGEMVSKGGKVKHIGINATNFPENAREILLHETQHAIQKLEGWQGGGNTEQFIRSNIERELNRQLEGVKGTEKESGIRQIQKNLQNIYYKQYQKIPGEQEAKFTEVISDKNEQQIENILLNLLKSGKTPSSYRE